MRAPSPLLLALAMVVPRAAPTPTTLSEEQYYSMPALFQLDAYSACVARGALYCLGSFELTPAPHDARAAHLYNMMQMYSSNWVDNFNHTRLHRGLCVSARCSPPAPAPAPAQQQLYEQWFAACVNASTMSGYGLAARPLQVEYCQAGVPPAPPPTPAARALAALAGTLLVLAALATLTDLALPDHARKKWWVGVATAWSVPGCWRALSAAPGGAGGGAGGGTVHTDLRAFDGLRVLCLMCVVIEHVAWLTTQAYLADTRQVELTRRATDAMMMANSTLVVQIFFLMSSFLLAHKLLCARRRGHPVPALHTFASTMLNRLIRISPSYWVVVWWAGTWWERAGAGPLWAPLVGAEAAVCRRKWWTHLLYLNNILDADDKCLIQTWYLAADMQLYALGLALSLALLRLRRAALLVLAALLAAAVAAVAALAYSWSLVPTFVMHNPESVRSVYRDGRSFNVLYQSPLGNAAGALAGLLLAHLHHHLRDQGLHLNNHKVFGWVSTACVPLAAWWVAASPRLAAGTERAPAAALAALERPVFAALVALALLGAAHSVPSSVARVLGWRGWRVPARLSFGALLLHMPLNKALVAARAAPAMLDRTSVIVEWFGVASVSFLLAVPLALLVELPTQRLHAALRALPAPAKPAPERPHHDKPQL